LIRLFCFCSDNEISACEISQSDYHCYSQDQDAIKKLKCLSFVSERSHLKTSHIIKEGKGKNIAYCDARVIDLDNNILLMEDDNIINDELYINCKGDILTSCNLSYLRQDKNKIGNILSDKLITLVKSEALKS